MGIENPIIQTQISPFFININTNFDFDFSCKYINVLKKNPSMFIYCHS